MKLRGSWGVSVTETFRWASGSSPKSFGFNLQTCPKQFRHCYLPPVGMVFVQPDLSQAEARIVAYLARCESMVELFNDPRRSVHMEKANQIWPGREIIKDSPEYVLAKASRHAGNYKLGPFKFSLMTGIPLKEAKLILDVDHRMYPEIPRWHQEILRTLETTGTLVNPFGEKRVFYEAISCRSVTGKITDPQWKDAISWIPQSTVPGIIDRAMEQLREDLPEIRFHHQGHDSMLVSCTPEMVPAVAAAMKRRLEIPLKIHGRVLIIPAEIAVGYNWGMMMKSNGEIVTRQQWQQWVEKNYTAEKKRKMILHGILGPHLGEILDDSLKDTT